MKQEARDQRTLQFWLAKEFIEERLGLSVSLQTIAEFAAHIYFLEKQSYKTKKCIMEELTHE